YLVPKDPRQSRWALDPGVGSPVGSAAGSSAGSSDNTFPLQSDPMSSSVAGGPWTVRRLLEWTSGFFTRKNLDGPRLSAELLLAHVLNYPRIKLYTDYERTLEEKDLTRFRALVQRAGEHEPIAYLTGRAHFFNLEFEV